MRERFKVVMTKSSFVVIITNRCKKIDRAFVIVVGQNRKSDSCAYCTQVGDFRHAPQM